MDVTTHFSDIMDVPALWMFQCNKFLLTDYMYGVCTVVETSPYWSLDTTSSVDCELFQLLK